MTHPDENALVEFVDGLLAPPARAQVNAHLVSCAACRQLVARVASDDDASEVRGHGATRPGAPAIRPSPVLEPGAHIGRYVVLHRVGEGGMGVVYAAHDPNLSRRVAIKMLRTTDDFGSQRARLFREAQAMARLSHPNVVSVYDVGTHEDQVFLAMEHVDGVTLSEWLGTPRTTREILDAFLQAGTGLAAAHAAGLVHRDFKPSNVLVEAEGRVRVMDFGLARTASSVDAAKTPTAPGVSSLEVTELTRTGMLMGTPAYMSPEQLSGEQTDLRTDQFSFCVALYEALFGQRPFKGTDLGTISLEIAAGRFQPPSVSRRVPARVRRTLLRGLEQDPARRFRSMDTLCAELSAARTGAWRPALGLVALGLVLGGVAWRALAVAPAPAPKAALALPASASPPPSTQAPPPWPVGAVTAAPAPAQVPAPNAEPPRPRPAAPVKPHVTRPAPRSGTGILSVHVTPWGDMFVDDKKLDSENMMDAVAELSAGPHRLRVTNPHLGERTEQVVIEPARTLDKRIDLARRSP